MKIRYRFDLMRELYNRLNVSLSSTSIHHYDDSYKTHIILAKRPDFSISIDYDDYLNDSTDERYLNHLKKTLFNLYVLNVVFCFKKIFFVVLKLI